MNKIINEQLTRMKNMMGLTENVNEEFDADYSPGEYFIDTIQQALYGYMDYCMKSGETNPEQFRSDIEHELDKLITRYITQKFGNQPAPVEMPGDSPEAEVSENSVNDDTEQYMDLGGQAHATPTKNIDFFVDSIRKKRPNGVTPTEAIKTAEEWEYIQDDADKYTILTKLANAGLLNLGNDGTKMKPGQVGAFMHDSQGIVKQLVNTHSMGVNESFIVEKKDIINKFKKQYGKKKGEKVYYATANKQGRNPETFKADEEKEK